ncbi:LysR family transcriptional regulator, mexEF-oprN operon transcriptional activator [Roseomonas rosea]|uniref:LysR family transcriptional regulator, mexEF-oprN operon transcriptional activator n=1 Tax=Muricoccus roseus TaxID=198092 RepID=A0A1M6DJP0_9PROT|nr:LysR family transcriptional regulator [Roseomonas rosea]SHI73476.1 LysR family transcriptional regulator, mexEF-oprN operon transcriptional activator [Roseomonas rosea]
MVQRSHDGGLRRLDMNLLPVFAALMRERSVTRAGEVLFLSQPATSSALARLRAFFGDELFIRNGRTLEPTPKAEALMEQLAPAMQAVAGAIASSIPFDPATDTRTFRIGMSEDVQMAMIPVLPLLRKAAPHCRIIIRSGTYRTIPRMLESREINTAIGHTEDLPAATKQRVIRRGGWRVLRDSASPGPVDLNAYCERPHMLVTPRGDLSGFADEELARLGRKRQVVLGVPDFGLMPRTLIGTDMLCLVTEAVVDAVAALGGLERLAADPPPIPCPEAVTTMAWRTAVDQDAGEVWLRAQLVQHLARR